MVKIDIDKDYVYSPSIEVPKRIRINYSVNRYPSETSWLNEAMKNDVLKWTFHGSITSLCPHGKEAEIVVVDVLTPKLIPNITLYRSARGNWHVGHNEEEHLKSATEISALNPGNYSYFQDNQFFLAICKNGLRKDGEQYILFVHKKPPLPGAEPRAEQD